jgi:hypothetical protein
MTQNDSHCQGLYWQTAHRTDSSEVLPPDHVTLQIGDVNAVIVQARRARLDVHHDLPRRTRDTGLAAAEGFEVTRRSGRIRILVAIIGALGIVAAALIAAAFRLGSG